MNNATSETVAKMCDDTTIESASLEQLAETLTALCAQVSRQDQRRRELVATLRAGAEHARALEAEIQQHAGTRSA